MSALPRVGIGTDVHAYAADPGRELWLAGLLWPGERGLEGHSDADVAAHAACDAIFTAAGSAWTKSSWDRSSWPGARRSDRCSAMHPRP